MYKIYLASQKIPKVRFAIFSKLITWWTKGDYFHTEIFIDFGDNYGKYYSSTVKKGVRSYYYKKDIIHFDYYDISYLVTVKQINEFFNKTKGLKYDFFGIFSFILRFITHKKSRYFCSEWCAEALGLFKGNEYRLHPTILVELLKEKSKSYKKCQNL